MNLPTDTTQALEERRHEASAIPRSKGFTGYKSHYSPSFTGRSQVHPDMTPEECSQSMMVWIYPSFVAAISPNSSVYMSITPDGPTSLQTRWGVIARNEVFDSGEANERMAFARAFNTEDEYTPPHRATDVHVSCTSAILIAWHMKF